MLQKGLHIVRGQDIPSFMGSPLVNDSLQRG